MIAVSQILLLKRSDLDALNSSDPAAAARFFNNVLEIASNRFNKMHPNLASMVFLLHSRRAGNLTCSVRQAKPFTLTAKWMEMLEVRNPQVGCGFQEFEVQDKRFKTQTPPGARQRIA